MSVLIRIKDNREGRRGMCFFMIFVAGNMFLRIGSALTNGLQKDFYS